MTSEQESGALLDAVEQLAPKIRARAGASEQAATMDPELVAEAKTAGFFRLGVPRSLGGWECDPATIFSLIEKLAHADGSAAWTIASGNGTTLLAWLEPEVAREMLSSGDVAASGVTAPLGRAEQIDRRAFRVWGRWPFSSGCLHSEWLLGGVLIVNQGEHAPVPASQGGWRIAWLAREDVEILENWDVLGLRGTGSHDVVADGIVVPNTRVCSPLFEPAHHRGPLYRLSLHNLVAILLAGVPAGIARRALDEFVAFASTKIRTGARRALAKDEAVQVDLAIAEGNLRAGRSLFLQALRAVWDTVVAGDECTLEQRAGVLLAAQTLTRLAVASVDTVFSLSGGAALYASNPLQRCFRDIHAASQHVLFSSETLKRVSRLTLGIGQPTFTL